MKHLGTCIIPSAPQNVANGRRWLLGRLGTTVPHRRNDPDGEHGRGLPILAMLTRSWGFEQLDDRRLRVWFEVPHTAVPNPRNAAGSESLQGTPSAPRPDDGNHESSTANHAAHVNDR